MVILEDDQRSLAHPTDAEKEIVRLRNALDRSIENWHKTEMELARAKDALTQILRMPMVGALAKAVAREALAKSIGIRE